MKIEKIHLPTLRNDEHFQFNTEFRNLVNEITPAALKIAAQWDSYLPLYDREDEALKKILKSAITEMIQDADQRRDLIFRGLVDANLSALNHFREEAKMAAKRLKVVFDTYGNLARKPLNEETSAIYNLLQELRNNYSADIGDLNLVEWVDELEAANQTFEALVKERYNESAARTEIILRQARLEIDAAYRSIIERIDALNLIEGNTVFNDFVRRWNVVIEKYNNIVAQRQGRNRK